MFLNACGIGQTQNCYFQTGVYNVNITQEGLSTDENFTVQGEKIQAFSLVQFLSTIANNTDSLILIIGVLIIFVVLLSLVTFFILKRFGLIR